MLKPASLIASRLTLPLAGALAAFAICSASPVFAQDADAPAEDAMTDEEKAAEKAATLEKQAKAKALHIEGVAAVAEADYTLAVSKFEEAYENFPDVQLQVKIGDAYHRDGIASLDYDKLRKAIEAYQKYVDKVPEGKTTDAINGRISELEETIQNEEDRKQRVIDEEKKAQETAKADEEKKANALLAKEKLKKEMQIVFSGGLLAGSDQDLTGIIRMSGGALLSWEKFAVDAKLGIDGFLRIDKDRGIRGKSFPVLDVGVRYGLNYRFVGPFFSGGASFGLINGKPRERLLKDDDATCGGGDCAFSIDKTITARVGIGYGFEATETSTVALKIELQNWFFSVDDEQGIGSVPAGSVDKPQTSFAVMFGLEFLRWL